MPDLPWPVHDNADAPCPPLDVRGIQAPVQGEIRDRHRRDMDRRVKVGERNCDACRDRPSKNRCLYCAGLYCDKCCKPGWDDTKSTTIPTTTEHDAPAAERDAYALCHEGLPDEKLFLRCVLIRGTSAEDIQAFEEAQTRRVNWMHRLMPPWPYREEERCHFEWVPWQWPRR